MSDADGQGRPVEDNFPQEQDLHDALREWLRENQLREPIPKYAEEAIRLLLGSPSDDEISVNTVWCGAFLLRAHVQPVVNNLVQTFDLSPKRTMSAILNDFVDHRFELLQAPTGSLAADACAHAFLLIRHSLADLRLPTTGCSGRL